MTDQLFVYGTLRRDAMHPAHDFLARRAEFVGYARVEGRLYDAGSYPFLSMDNGLGAEVMGEVYRLLDPSTALEMLDAYEGSDPNDAASLFSRSELPVSDLDGNVVRAWVYVGRITAGDSTPVPEGDYAVHLKKRANPDG